MFFVRRGLQDGASYDQEVIYLCGNGNKEDGYLSSIHKLILNRVADEFGICMYSYFFEESCSICADRFIAKREKLGNLTDGFSQRE